MPPADNTAAVHTIDLFGLSSARVCRRLPTVNLVLTSDPSTLGVFYYILISIANLVCLDIV